MRAVFLVAAVSAVLFASPTVSAPLEPVGKWNLDYGDAACIAARQYGSAADPTTFAIVPSISGDNYEIIVNLPHSGPSAVEEASGSVNFGTHGIATMVLHYGDRALRKDVYKYVVTAKDMESGRAATSVTLRKGAGSPFVFALTDMAALLDGLKNCTADLQNYWNIGPSRAGRLSRSARPLDDVRTVFTGQDYPSEASAKGQEGTAQYLLMIDEKGSVIGCDVTRRSGVPVLDAMGCAVMQERAKFAPALDAQGKPARDMYTTPPISWRLM